MKHVLPWLFCCGLVAAGPAARPLSDFNLTEPTLERYGFRDTAEGLKDTVRNALFMGKDRELVLQEIASWIADEAAKKQREEDRPEHRQTQTGADLTRLAGDSRTQAELYDKAARPGESEREPVAGENGKLAALPPASILPPRSETAPPAPRPPPAASSGAVGLQARGSLDKLVELVIKSLPGDGVADAARRLTEKAVGAPPRVQTKEGLAAYCRAASQSCLSALAEAYFGPKKASVDEEASQYGGLYVRYADGDPRAYPDRLRPEARQSAPEVQALIERGFRAELGLGPETEVRVVFSSDQKLLKNRGVWLANPILRERDGSYTLVFNDKLLDSLQGGDAEGWAGGLDLTPELKAVDAAEREHLLRDIVGGGDPQRMGGRLNYALLGWMQADVLKRLGEAEAAGKTPEEARRETQNTVLRDPLEGRLYTLANNSVTAWVEGDARVGPQGEPSRLWTLVERANGGDSAAISELMAFLKGRRQALDEAKAAHAALELEYEKASRALEKAQPDANATYETISTLTGKKEDVWQRLLDESKRVAEAEDGSRKGRAYLGYLDLSRPASREALRGGLSELSPEDQAAAMTRLALAGASEDVGAFASAIVARENQQRQESYARAIADLGPSRPSSAPKPRVLDGSDAEFLSQVLNASRSRPSMRDDFRALVSGLSKAEKQRDYEAVLGRQSGLWSKLRAQLSQQEWAALLDKAPASVRSMIDRALSASGDNEEEAVIQRAARLNADFATVEAAAQKVEARYNAYPMMIMDYLQEPDVIGPILDASRRTGMDPYLVTAAAFQEGYIEYAKAIESGDATRYTYYFHSMVGPMGLDSFPGTVDWMKKKGWLRPDFNDYRITLKPLGAGDYGDADFIGPDPAEAALEALVGLLRLKRAVFLGSSGALGIRASTIPRQDLELWTYLYFNFTNPDAQLRKLGLGWVWKSCKASDDLYKVKRVGATAEWLRELKFFEGVKP